MMLIQSANSLDVSQASVGDEFFIIKPGKTNHIPTCESCIVKKITQKQIFFVFKSHPDYEVAHDKQSPIRYGALLDSEAFDEAQILIRLDKKRKEAARLIERYSVNYFPESLCDAIIHAFSGNKQSD